MRPAARPIFIFISCPRDGGFRGLELLRARNVIKRNSGNPSFQKRDGIGWLGGLGGETARSGRPRHLCEGGRVALLRAYRRGIAAFESHRFQGGRAAGSETARAPFQPYLPP